MPETNADLAARLRALMANATPGPWRSRGMGGHSTLMADVEPARNDTRIPGHAYRRDEFSISYPFLEDRRDGKGYDVRLDFTCFAHADAALIAELVNNLHTILAALSRDAGADELTTVKRGRGRILLDDEDWKELIGEEEFARIKAEQDAKRPLPTPPRTTITQPRVGHREEGIE